jgi:hypothetical protein
MASASARMPKTRGVFGTEVLVDDDDGKVKAEHGLPTNKKCRKTQSVGAKCRVICPRLHTRYDELATLGRSNKNKSETERFVDESTHLVVDGRRAGGGELATGTFYLLMLALGRGRRFGRHAGLGTEVQLSAAPWWRRSLPVAWHAWKRRRQQRLGRSPFERTQSTPDLDIGSGPGGASQRLGK